MHVIFSEYKFFRPTQNLTPSCTVILFTKTLRLLNVYLLRRRTCTFVSFPRRFRVSVCRWCTRRCRRWNNLWFKKKKNNSRYVFVLATNRSRLLTWQCFINKQKTSRLKKKIFFYVHYDNHIRLCRSHRNIWNNNDFCFVDFAFIAFCCINVRLCIRCRYDWYWRFCFVIKGRKCVYNNMELKNMQTRVFTWHAIFNVIESDARRLRIDTNTYFDW